MPSLSNVLSTILNSFSGSNVSRLTMNNAYHAQAISDTLGKSIEG